MGTVGAAGEEFGIFADESFARSHAAGRDWFANGDGRAAPREPLGDGGGDHRLADAGVGAGDEKAGNGNGIQHGFSALGIGSQELIFLSSWLIAATMMPRSSWPIASGGIRITTSPRGRRITPLFRNRMQNSAPTR